jgi:hypothetical protein
MKPLKELIDKIAPDLIKTLQTKIQSFTKQTGGTSTGQFKFNELIKNVGLTATKPMVYSEACKILGILEKPKPNADIIMQVII